RPLPAEDAGASDQLADHQTAPRLTPQGGGGRPSASFAPSPPPEADNDDPASGTEEVATAALEDRDVASESDPHKAKYVWHSRG
ncbi:hypothetical protein SEPCBS119000_006777, partial [Sporothrix epigloea]